MAERGRRLFAGDAVSADLLTLARAVVALPGWEWRPGMLTVDGERMLVDVACGLMRYIAAPYDESDRDMMADAVPNLADDATGGVMLALLATTEPVVRVSVWGSDRVAVDTESGRLRSFSGRTLGEAVAKCAISRGRWA